jgi:hypothetical protein
VTIWCGSSKGRPRSNAVLTKVNTEVFARETERERRDGGEREPAALDEDADSEADTLPETHANPSVTAARSPSPPSSFRARHRGR